MKHGKMLRKQYWQRKCCKWCHPKPTDALRRSTKRRERQAWKKLLDN